MAAAYEDDKINWEKYMELIKGLDWLTYNPPQKKPEWTGRTRNFNFFTPRTPWLRGFPFCVAEGFRCYLRCKGADIKHVYISQPDEWFNQMLSSTNPDCPDWLRGVWHMYDVSFQWQCLDVEDNVANETVVTMEDAMWKNGIGYKWPFVNWTTGSSWWGSVLLGMKYSFVCALQISPDKKWISFSRDDYIYVLGPEDKMVDATGKEIPFVVGQDLLRITWTNGDPKQGIYYQYLMRKVAYKDEDGKLVKTPAYQDLLDRATRPTAAGCCCNLCLCNVSDEDYPSIYDQLDDHQLLVLNETSYPAAEPADPADLTSRPLLAKE
ncbi:unnamed protein product [Effrenium voratum]|uniref:Uncharacterized protein n=1 Tax=Effrenium voratum TaxID=2562239 RepID=A0AA36HMM3_9DINO|nr:unnamed protein product [Effrenium voratum]CAJ1421689.1 unnamed protein product [Effrenium voratum]